MTIILTFLGACVFVAIAGFFLACLLDDVKQLDEAERRDKGQLLQDEEQAAALLRKYEECRERMGRECCLHPEYQFDEKHRQVVGRE